MADIELVIKIPEGAKQAFDCAESNDLKGCYYDHGGVIGNAIKNGTPLPKGHGNLKDVSNLLTVTDIRSDGSEFTYVSYSEIEDAPTIIEADKESEDKR